MRRTAKSAQTAISPVSEQGCHGPSVGCSGVSAASDIAIMCPRLLRGRSRQLEWQCAYSLSRTCSQQSHPQRQAFVPVALSSGALQVVCAATAAPAAGLWKHSYQLLVASAAALLPRSDRSSRAQRQSVAQILMHGDISAQLNDWLHSWLCCAAFEAGSLLLKAQGAAFGTRPVLALTSPSLVATFGCCRCWA